MSVVEERLRRIGLSIPGPSPRVANYVGAVRTGDLVFVSGHGPYRDGDYIYRGKLGRDLGVEQGYEAAKLVILNCLASLKEVIGDLDHVVQVVKVFGMVNCTADFEAQPQVINGASDLLVEVFGERGHHARSAVGMGSLPMGIAVEIELIVRVE